MSRHNEFPSVWESPSSWLTTGRDRNPPKGCWTRSPSTSFQICSQPHICYQWDGIQTLTLIISVMIHLLLHNRLTTYLTTSHSTERIYYLTLSVDRESGHNLAVCFLRVSWSCMQAVSQGQVLTWRFNWRRPHFPTHVDVGNTVLHPWGCRTESFKAFCWLSVPRGHLHFFATWAFPRCLLTSPSYQRESLGQGY